MNITHLVEKGIPANPLPMLHSFLKRHNHTAELENGVLHVYNPATPWDADETAQEKFGYDMIELSWSPSDDELRIEHFISNVQDHAIDSENMIIDGGRVNQRQMTEVLSVIEQMFRKNELR